MKCPNCHTEMESINYEEIPVFDVWEIARAWYYECPNCKKQWEEYYHYQCSCHTINEKEK